MSTQLRTLFGIAFVLCFGLNVTLFAEGTDPNAPVKKRMVSTRDPRTGKITTQEVEVTDAGAMPEMGAQGTDQVPMRTIQTRDPRTGRTITQQVPADAGRSRGGVTAAMDPEKRALRYQKLLGIADDQWETIKPLLTNTLKLQMALNPAANLRNRAISTRVAQPGQGRGDMVRQDAQPEDVGNPDAEMKAAFDALLEMTRNAEATDEQIVQVMQGYIQKRHTLEEELKTAQQELRNTLTVRQQAQLTVEGVLE
ncbi:MAG: hypothetical protein LLF76_14330 [Planctomycetaceae bacterium]|nr:hypothetical protein [Planctomycetaceae bacterium]